MRRCRTGALALAVGILLSGMALAETSAESQAMFVPKVAAGETLVDSGQAPDFVENLLTVAEGELGYTEGPNNYSKYGVWSGDPHVTCFLGKQTFTADSNTITVRSVDA